MLREVSLACLVLIFVGSFAWAEEAPDEPKSAPPTITTVRLSKEGNLEIFDYSTRREMRATSETIVKDGKPHEVIRTSVAEVPILIVRQISATGATIYDLDGNEYEWKDVEKLLAKPTPVLLSRGPKQIDPFYRRMFQMGTLMLVLPAEPAADFVAPPATSTVPRR